MKLTFKNKKMVMMNDIIKKSANRGAIPDEIEMHPDEAIGFLDEILIMEKDEKGAEIVKDHIRIVARHHEQLPSIIRLNNLITELGSKRVMELWKGGEYEIKYRKIPITVIDRRS